MKTVTAILTLMLATASPAQDFHFVDFDSEADFTAVKTFSLREGELTGLGSDLNRHAINTIREGVRSDLASRGLKETADRADVTATYTIAVSPIGKESNATLKIDLTRNGRRIWRGHYESGPRVASTLPKMLRDAVTMLLKKYPPAKA